MQRHESFLDHIHRVLSLPGTSVPLVAHAIDEVILACGACVPTESAVSAMEIRSALVSEGIVAARRRLEARRGSKSLPRASGIFEDLGGGRLRAPVEGVRHQLLIFEVDDNHRVQLLGMDRGTPEPIGEPRHIAFLHYVYRHGPTTLAAALEASGSSAIRRTNVFYESRDHVGRKWFARSDPTGSPYKRIVRMDRPTELSGLYECRVQTLTAVPDPPSPRARRTREG
jgi:hypothetical protein